MEHSTSFRRQWRKPIGLMSLGALLLILAMPHSASAQSAWDPTLLVNTESFQIIDEGDGTTDVEIRFGQTLDERLYFNRSTNLFQFTDDLQVDGNISGSGTLTVEDDIATAGDNITINKDDVDQDAILTFGNDAGAETLRFNNQFNRFVFSDDVAVENNLTASGTIKAEGNLSTDANITLNEDNTAADAVLTFGNDAGAETLTFSDTTNNFIFSDDVRAEGNLDVTGTLSGDTLVVSKGNVTINGVAYDFTDTQGSAGQVLQNDGAGNLTWQDVAVGAGSGAMISLHPEYPNAVYAGTGSSSVGRLRLISTGTASGSFYRWRSSRPTDQTYNIVVRLRVPENFSGWATNDAITLQYRTGLAATTNNYVKFKVYDTATSEDYSSGELSSLSAAEDTANAAALGGTYTAGEYMTIHVEVMANNTANSEAEAGYLNINWATTTP